MPTMCVPYHCHSLEIYIRGVKVTINLAIIPLKILEIEPETSE